MKMGEHLNKKGIIKIISLKALLNKEVSNTLKTSFSNIIKIDRYNKNIPTNIYPN